MTKQHKLDQIAAEIVKNNVCPDLAQTATMLVMGDGNPDADILFIGEAPGKKEDETGKPFVGAAGKFLDEMLASIKLDRGDVYITNIVKYRPPDNRDPEPEEKKEFFPYLIKQLAVIEPKVIIPLGRHSMNVFLPDFKISQVHGNAYRRKLIFPSVGTPEKAGGDSGDDMQGAGEKRTKVDDKSSAGASESGTRQIVRDVVILPLYHPAAALYNGGMRETLLEDFSAIPHIIETN